MRLTESLNPQLTQSILFPQMLVTNFLVARVFLPHFAHLPPPQSPSLQWKIPFFAFIVRAQQSCNVFRAPPDK